MAASRDYKVTVQTGRGNTAVSTVHAQNESQAREVHTGSGNLKVVKVEAQPDTERTS